MEERNRLIDTISDRIVRGFNVAPAEFKRLIVPLQPISSLGFTEVHNVLTNRLKVGVPAHATTAYGRAHTRIWNLALYLLNRKLGGSKSRFEHFEEKKLCWPCRESNHQSLVVPALANSEHRLRYTCSYPTD